MAKHFFGALLAAATLLSCVGCSKPLELGGAWSMGGPYNVGQPCSITQDGNALTFVNEKGEKSNGFVKDQKTVIATDWGGMEGILVDDATRINWKNDTWWLRVK